MGRIEIRNITEQLTWVNFFNENNSPSFLQSWEWGEVQIKVGYSVMRLGIYDNNHFVGITQVIKIKSKKGSFLLIPHGPIFQFSISNIQHQKIKTYLIILTNYLINIAKKEKYSFIRMATILEDKSENQQIFKELGYKKAPIYVHAERTWVLNLTPEVGVYLSDETLLAQMRRTTRYSIKKAIRDGVIIEKRSDEQMVDDFYHIFEETAQREKFVPYSKKFIGHEYEEFNKTGNSLFIFGKLNNTYYASALIIFTKSSAFYHQGASIHTKTPITYLLQWEAIKEAKKRGCQFYNFWGILQPGRTPKNWGGITLFKTGFGGRQIDYLPAQDYIISPSYFLSYLYDKFLAWKRGV